MGRALLFLIAVTGCSPLDGFAIEKHSREAEVVLPFRCQQVDRTSGGLWICLDSGNIVTSAGQTLLGGEFAVVGSVVWTTAVARYEEDLSSGALVLSPDSPFDRHGTSMIRQQLTALPRTSGTS